MMEKLGQAKTHIELKKMIAEVDTTNSGPCILVPRGRAPFGQHQESRPLVKPLAWSNDIPFLNGFVNTID